MRKLKAILPSRLKHVHANSSAAATFNCQKIDNSSNHRAKSSPVNDISQSSLGTSSGGSVTSSPFVLPPSPVPASTCSRLWDKALASAQTLPQWEKFCEILSRQQINEPSDSPKKVHTAGHNGQQHDFKIGEGSLAALNEALEILAARKLKSDSSSFRSLCVGASQFILKGKEVGSAVAALNPYASLAWGIVAFVAGAINNNHDIRQSCWRSLKDLQEVVRRSEALQRFYTAQVAHPSQESLFKQLDDAITVVFAAIINYAISVVVFHGSKAEKLQAMVKDKNENTPKQYLNKVFAAEQQLREVRLDVTITLQSDRFESLEIELEHSRCSLSAMEDRVQSIGTSLAFMNQKSQTKYHRKVLEWISGIKPLEAHNKAYRHPMSGTTDWLLELDQFKSWAASSSNGILWLAGKMGSGKTCTTHSVIESLSLAAAQTSKVSTIYFYCDGTSFISAELISSVDSILRSLVKQLASLEGLEHLPYCVTELYDAQQLNAPPSVDQCEELMKKLSYRLTQLTVIIDGLDECPKDVGVELIRRLTATLPKGPACWKLYVSSRNDTSMERIRKKYRENGLLTHEIKIENYSQDAINSYIERSVMEHASPESEYHHLYVSGDSDQTSEVINQLKKYAQGMFRWVSLSLAHLHACEIFAEMVIARGELARLPHLFDLYDKIFERIMSNKRREIIHAVQITLTFLLCGLCHQSEVQDSSSTRIIQACSSMSTPRFSSTYSLDDVAALCPGFIEKSGESISFAHFSVREYLQDRRGKEYQDNVCHARLAAFCMNLFDFSGGLPKEIESYAAQYWPDHLRSIKLYGFLHGDTPSDVRAKCTEFGLPFLIEPLENFLLSQPVSGAFVKWETAAVQVENRSGIFLRLLTVPLSTIYARICLNIGWKDESFPPHLLNVTNNPCHLQYSEMEKKSTLDFAASAGALRAIGWLAHRDIDINQKMDWWGDNVLHRFIASNRRQDAPIRAVPDVDANSVIKTLLDYGVDLHATNRWGFDVLFRWVTGMELQTTGYQLNSSILLNTLLELGFELVSFNRITRFGSRRVEDVSLLEHAIESGRSSFAFSIVEQWLKSQYWGEVRDRCLIAAAARSKTRMVLFLLDNGANPLAMSEMGYPLELFLKHHIQPGTAEKTKAIETVVSRLTHEMIDQGYDFSLTAPKIPGKPHPTSLFYKVLRFGDLKTIKTWIEHGADPNISYKRPKYSEYRPIHLSAKLSINYSREVDEYFQTLPEYESSKLRHERMKRRKLRRQDREEEAMIKEESKYF